MLNMRQLRVHKEDFKKKARLRQLTMMIVTLTTCTTNFLPKNRCPIADAPLAEREKTESRESCERKNV